MADKKQDFSDVPARLLLKRFEEARVNKERFNGTWERNSRLYNANSWKGIEDIAWFQSHPDYAKVYEFVEIMRGFLSDNKWGLDVIPASIPTGFQKALDGDNSASAQDAVRKVAEQMGSMPAEDAPEQEVDLFELLNEKAARTNRLLDFLWSENRAQSKLAATLQHVFLKGTGLIKATFDPDNVGDSGIGQIETRVIDPTYFFPDPDATSMHDGSFYMEKHPVSVRWVLEHYPERAGEFLASMGQSTMDAAPSGTRTTGAVNPDEGKRLDVIECWYKDSAVWEEDSAEDGAKKGDKKFANGRWSLITDKAVVLDDHPNEYDALAPYARFVEVEVAGEFWGGCTVDKVAPIQLIINQILRSIIDNGLWMVHGIWVVDEQSGLTPESLAGYGMRDVVVKKAGSEARRDVGDPLPHTIFQTLENMITAFDRVAGIPDIMRGIAPSRQPVGTSQLQQESGEVRTRDRSRRVEEGLADLGRIWLDIVAKFWVDKRTVRNQNGIGGFDMFQLSKDDFEEWRFDLQVLPGSTTPLDTAMAFERAKSMRMEMNIPIPDEFFIRLAQIPQLEASVLKANKEAQAAEEAPVEPEEFEGMEDPDSAEGDQFPLPEEEEMSGIPPEMMGQFP
jgi:hypothetical protein